LRELSLRSDVTYQYDRSMARKGSRTVPSIAELRQRIRELVVVTGNLVWTDHIAERMEQRGFDSEGVLRILQEGDINEEPEPAKRGDWKVKVVRRMVNGREAGVVTVINRNTRLILLTIEWEDLR
jgi:hypothetical protein